MPSRVPNMLEELFQGTITVVKGLENADDILDFVVPEETDLDEEENTEVFDSPTPLLEE